ncbi:MAG: fibronectin type III domain-containing protein, partial [Acidimicrobiia bacterium]|nr:fibronectin type III domain-containing protein [Acidimicrobiia bacterium]
MGSKLKARRPMIDPDGARTGVRARGGRRWVAAMAGLAVAMAVGLMIALWFPLTSGGADTSGPSTPTSVAGRVDGSALTVLWSPSSDDVGVTGYLVHRDGVFLAWVPAATSFTDTAVTAGRVYRYEIRAQDAARNNSAPSAPLDLGLAGVG